ncbi:hypothetical protein ZOSMA_24G00890 [Zostera marina]|uniref:ABC transmembrane type-1 domain-containing protein n=1 Tax=Zostera marina TaxID=29655 RepID=A0A0K9PGH8_ZOSMR|nr:hypothetical protein ZOSMA_24G00890 [Zostera marina]
MRYRTPGTKQGWRRAWYRIHVWYSLHVLGCGILVQWYAGVFVRTDGGKAFTAIFSAIGQAFTNLGAFTKGNSAGHKLIEIIRQKPSIIENSTGGKRLTKIQGNVDLKNVAFCHPLRPEVLKY